MFSLNYPRKVEIKEEHVFNTGEIEDNSIISGMEFNKTKTCSIVKTPSTTRKTRKSYKESLQKEYGSNQIKGDLSNRSINSTKIITHSLQDSSKQSIIDSYKIFPKSMPSSVNVNSNLITVTFKLEEISFSTAFCLTTTMEQIKKWLFYFLEIEEDLLILEVNDIEANNSHTLADLGGQPCGKVVFKISSKSERGKAIVREKINENIPTLDVITVHLDEIERHKNIIVEIENESVVKQWLGGYRNKLTGTEYHHAYSQTIKKKKVFEYDEASGKKVPLFLNRDSQTHFPPLDKTVDTAVNKATQMSRSDFYLTSNRDKIITAKRYITNEKNNFNEYYITCVLTIQTYLRRWIAFKKFKSIIDIQIEELSTFKKSKRKILQLQADKERIVITGAAFPVKRDDFYTLFLKIDKWWKKEWKKICETKSLGQKNAASALLIEKEINLLQSIEKHKAAVKKESLKKEEICFLERTSRPELFRSSKGQLIVVDYLDTQKAREFKEIYSALTRKDSMTRDRVEILITLKNLFESHYMSYEYAKDLVSLINQEIQLIQIGIKLNDLKGLRSRIEQLFQNFLHQSEFNPSVKKYKNPNLPKTLTQTFQCYRCCKLLPASKYQVHVRMTAFTQCKSCTWIQNIAHQRADLSPYLKLLLNVRNSEIQKCYYSAICFIMQPIGMAFLTNVIWHGRSAISECSDISKLNHIRFLPDVEWAPWNTILLTNQEAKFHTNIPDIFSFYDTKFIEKVRQKHILARKRFIPLLIMDHDIRSSDAWANITDSGVFLHPSHLERMATESNEFDTI